MKTGMRSKWWIMLLAIGAVFMVVGVMRGEAQAAFTKAVNVCLECIGIG